MPCRYCTATDTTKGPLGNGLVSPGPPTQNHGPHLSGNPRSSPKLEQVPPLDSPVGIGFSRGFRHRVWRRFGHPDYIVCGRSNSHNCHGRGWEAPSDMNSSVPRLCWGWPLANHIRRGSRSRQSGSPPVELAEHLWFAVIRSDNHPHNCPLRTTNSDPRGVP